MSGGARSRARREGGSVGWATPAPATSRRWPEHLLGQDASLILSVLAGAAAPRAWQHPRFAVAVGTVRRHLAPLRDRRLLLESLSREAFHARPDRRRPGAVRVAYAIRWLELTEGRELPPWSSWPPTAPG